MKKRQSLMIPFCLGALCLVGTPRASADSNACADDDYPATLLRLLDPPRRNQPPIPYGAINGMEDFTYLGLIPGVVEPWEDGLRTDPAGFSFEWWYYDAHFSDGSSAVVVFYTKPLFTPGAPETPYVEVTIVKENGQEVTRQFFASPSDASFSTDGCDVHLSEDNFTYGDLENYKIHVEIDDVAVDLDMQGLVPSWRPGTGHLFLGDYEQYFGWLPAIGAGFTSGTLTYDGVTHAVQGSGYHDHNWGNVRLYDHQKYWWWARAQVGPYTVITADQRMKNIYGTNAWTPVFVILDQNGALIDAAHPTVSMTSAESNAKKHPDPSFAGANNGKIANTVTFRVESTSGDWAELRLDAQGLLASVDLMPGFEASMCPTELEIAQRIGLDPWYSRFLAEATLTFDIGGLEYQGTGFSTLEKMDLE